MQNFKVLEDLDDIRIIPFLLRHPNASIYHHPGWQKSLVKTFKHTIKYLIAEDEQDNLTGLYPFCNVKSPFAGKKITSPPFASYCNLLFPDGIIVDAIAFLRAYFPEYKKIELRTLKIYSEELSRFTNTQDFITHFLELSNSTNETFNSFRKSSVRARILKTNKNGLSIRYGSTIEDLKLFYKFEVNLRKRIYLPPLPYNFFLNLWEQLSPYKLIQIPIIEIERKPIGAALLLNFKDTFYLEYSACLSKYLYLYPYHKLFWEITKFAHSQGAKRIDLGRSSNENIGLIKFKDNWGTMRHNIHHYFLPEVDLLYINKKHLINFF